jgi:hypothetical protein
MYPVIAEPFVDVGVSKETIAEPESATAVTFNGALGGAIGITELEAGEPTEVPIAFVAVTLKV